VWEAWTTRIGARSGKVPSVNTQVSVLGEARTFTKWLASKEWAKAGLLDGVEVLGRRKRGKAQFVGLDEARRFGAKALELAKAGDVGATAALTALVLGVRASEITDRTVRELDDGGRYLVITSAKTEAGIRRLRVPEMLQPLLVGLAAGKKPTDRIFGDGVGRHWVLRSVRRVCREAGVSVISAHGLRGSHATLAVDAGMSGPLVAKALGHEDFRITAAHYASADSVEGARIDRMLRNFSDDFPNRSVDSAEVPQPATC
jgi:integrase